MLSGWLVMLSSVLFKTHDSLPPACPGVTELGSGTLEQSSNRLPVVSIWDISAAEIGSDLRQGRRELCTRSCASCCITLVLRDVSRALELVQTPVGSREGPSLAAQGQLGPSEGIAEGCW